MSLRSYISLARPDHWMKNIFIIPGVFLAALFYHIPGKALPVFNIILSIIATCLIASSYYVLNEILDAESDKFHPEKKNRPIPSGRAKKAIASIECIILVASGFIIGGFVSHELLACLILLFGMAILYNVPPIRLKDRAYMDVITESVNNPLRLAIGWYAVETGRPPTLSALAAYWMFGAFLMAAKRFSEYRHIGDHTIAGDYRSSFKKYTEEYLLLSIMFYATAFAMCLGVFIARYRIEMVLGIPFIAWSMAQYLHVAFKPNSPVQHPERLHTDTKLMIVLGIAFLVCTTLLFVNVPILSDLFMQWSNTAP